MFVKHGCDSQGLLPYDLFAAKLLSSPARLLALEPERKVCLSEWGAAVLLCCFCVASNLR